MKKIFIILISLVVINLSAADINTDEVFKQAREAAFSGDRISAKQLCGKVLEIKPNYLEVKNFLARIYLWDKDYSQAKKLFYEVLAEDKTNLQAYYGLLDMYIWSDNEKEALKIVDNAISIHPDNTKLKYYKARILNNLDKKEEALKITKNLISLDEENTKAKDLKESILYDLLDKKIGISYSRSIFDKTFSPWRLFSFSYTFPSKYGSVILRYNRANRFSTIGKQFEIDAYPSIKKGMYAYLNFGYSNDSIFPDKRYGLEIYKNLKNAYEASLGLRYLKFTSSSVAIYTGTIGKYYKNYWFSLRHYYTPKNFGSSNSDYLTIRRYFATEDDYIFVSGGTGFSYDNEISTLGLLKLKSSSYSLGFNKRTDIRWIVSGKYSLSKEEIDAGEYRKEREYTVGLEYLFR